MKIRVVSVLVLFGVLVYPVAGRQGQKGQRKAGGKGATAGAAATQQQHQQQQGALQTLLYLKNSAAEIENAQDRVRVLVEVADALWIADQEQAREVFRQAFENAIEFESGLDEKRRKLFGMTLRQKVVTRVARRDPALADKMISTSVSKPSEPTPDEEFAQLYGLGSARGDVLVRAASEILTTDKSTAIQTARLAASDGFSQGLRRFIVGLRARDRAAADALFDLILQTASTRRPKEVVEALFLWDYAFQHGDIYLGPVSWLSEGKDAPTPVAPEMKRRALFFAVDAILENVRQFNLAAATEAEKPLVRQRYVLIHSLASQIMSDVEKLMPSSLPLLQTHLRRLDQELRDMGSTPPSLPEPLPTTASASDDVEKLLEIASRVTNPQVRDGVYARAALRLYLHQEYDRALEIARKIENPALALMLTEPIKFDRAGDLITRKELDAALAVARGIETPEVRITALARLGGAFFAAKKPLRAVEILTEAEAVAAKANPSVELASAVLGVAHSYTGQDRARVVDITSSAIRTANAVEGDEPWELLQAGIGDARLAAQNHNWVTGKGGIITSVSVAYPKVAGLLDVLSKLSESDLDDGLLLARQLKWKGLSLAAQAVVCREELERIHQDKRGQAKSKLRAE